MMREGINVEVSATDRDRLATVVACQGKLSVSRTVAPVGTGCAAMPLFRRACLSGTAPKDPVTR